MTAAWSWVDRREVALGLRKTAAPLAITHQQAHRAALQVAAHATDAQDARDLLRTLGLEYR